MPSARTVVLYTLLWARPERLGAGFSCGGRKMALTAPGSLMAAPQRAGRARVGPEACRRASQALEDARMQGWRAWERASQRWLSCERPGVCCVRFFVLRLLLLLVTVVIRRDHTR